MNLARDLPLPRDAGMSLIEVLVAVFIMAMAAGMVAMTMRAPADPLEEAAARLERDITSAMDFALVTGAPPMQATSASPGRMASGSQPPAEWSTSRGR